MVQRLLTLCHKLQRPDVESTYLQNDNEADDGLSSHYLILKLKDTFISMGLFTQSEHESKKDQIVNGKRQRKCLFS